MLVNDFRVIFAVILSANFLYSFIHTCMKLLLYILVFIIGAFRISFCLVSYLCVFFRLLFLLSVNRQHCSLVGSRLLQALYPSLHCSSFIWSSILSILCFLEHSQTFNCCSIHFKQLFWTFWSCFSIGAGTKVPHMLRPCIIRLCTWPK